MGVVVRYQPRPASRAISTNRASNPYHLDRGTRHICDQKRLCTYPLRSEPDMVRLAERPSSALIAAAIDPPSFQKSRSRDGPLGAVRRTVDTGCYEPAQQPSKSNKRLHADRDSSSGLSEHEDDDFSQVTRRRLTPASAKQRKSQRYLPDEDYEEKPCDEEEAAFDQDAEEEEALMRAIAQRSVKELTRFDVASTDGTSSDASKVSPPSYKTPAAKRRKQDVPTTEMDGMLYQTPTSNTGSTLRKKPKGKPVPQDLKTADAADRMMFRWKNAGRPWDEIRDEYHSLTGTRPAASSLSVRFIKLNENLAANGFKNEIRDSFFETYPDRSYLKKNTKPDLQEVALLKAVEAAKIKQAQAFWKEVVVQIKATTDLDFAAPSLRKKYEEIKKRQFFLGEQNPAKDSEWPTLQEPNNSHTIIFRNVSELTPINNKPVNMHDQAYGESEGRQTISNNTSNESLSIDRTIGEAADFEGMATCNAQERSCIFVHSKGEGREVSGGGCSAIQNENESPSHTHPRFSYGAVDYSREMSSDSLMPMTIDRSTPTPTPVIAAGAALMRTGGALEMGSGPRPALVGYGESDDID